MQRRVVERCKVGDPELELERLEANSDSVTATAVSVESHDLLTHGASEAVVRREIPVDETDKFILKQRQLGIRQQIAQDPGPQVQPLEDIAPPGSVALARKMSLGIRPKSPHRQIR